ncbi:MAG: outer membrane lipoprotein-sorting protein [Elusimicrobia bacterium]|nr:outer membrane lipoprotein-sorting protein [Elusimicrobiota bacterium]
MKVKTAHFILLLSFIFSPAFSFALEKNEVSGITPLELLKKIDELYRSDSSYGEMEMEVVTPNWTRTIGIKSWTRGMKKTFMYITAPQKDEGITTLRLNNKMWNYFPKINKVMRVPPSMMMGSWMGSDFTNDDLVKESTFLDDYTGEFFTPKEALEGIYYIRLKPKKAVVSLWAKIEILINKKNNLPVKQIYFDEKGRIARSMEFTDIKNLGGKFIPATLFMKVASKPGRKTVVKYKKIEFDIKIPESIFSIRNLQKKR